MKTESITEEDLDILIEGARNGKEYVLEGAIEYNKIISRFENNKQKILTALEQYPKLKEELELIKRNWDRGSMSAVEIRAKDIQSVQQIKDENQKLKAENEELKKFNITYQLEENQKLQQENESLRQLKQAIQKIDLNGLIEFLHDGIDKEDEFITKLKFALKFIRTDAS